MKDKLKILYACSNSIGSKIQLERFLQAIKDQPYQVKIAAYKNHSPKNINIDWTLDALRNIFISRNYRLDTENYDIFFNQVKSYDPDLIISDLEYFSSCAGYALNKIVWQCSSSLINNAVPRGNKYELGMFTKHSLLFTADAVLNQRTEYMINNSSENFIYSHFCDIDTGYDIDKRFSWVRPYYVVGKESKICKHNIVAAMSVRNKNIFSLLKRNEDSVAFLHDYYEKYDNVILKDINNYNEYICNIANCNLFVCQGQANFLADAMYNHKFTITFLDHYNTESVINSYMSEKFNLSKIVHDPAENLSPLLDNQVEFSYNNNVKFLHERI